jgi:hypothetical protein
MITIELNVPISSERIAMTMSCSDIRTGRVLESRLCPYLVEPDDASGDLMPAHVMGIVAQDEGLLAVNEGGGPHALPGAFVKENLPGARGQRPCPINPYTDIY